MFAFFKWLLWMCMPTTVCHLLLVGVWVWLLRRCHWRASAVMGVALLGLSVMSLPWMANRLGASLEGRYPPKPLSEIPQADAILLLGGGVGGIEEGVPYPECFSAADRVVMAARLYHAGKARLIIPSGGGAELAERPLLETMRVPPSAILCETEARDTAENATKMLAILRARGCRKALVVTSSWHLPRAMMLFQAPDIEFIPVGCDYEATLAEQQASKAPMWQKLPTQESAMRTSLYIKEYLGILFYSFKKPKQ